MFKYALVLLMAGSAFGCGQNEYCCPDALHCLTPTNVTCGTDPNVCTGGTVCCPLTKLCVQVGIPCQPQTVCTKEEYCCPEAKHCLRPTNPGNLCDAAHPCSGIDVCCPLTHECVAVGAACVAPRAGCNSTTYCDYDAKTCQTPSKVTCSANSDCAAGQACSPLTKLCSSTGPQCTPLCPAGSYCCPDAKHCLTPVNPGHLCSSAADCKLGEVCCPLTHECVSVGAACNP